MIVLFKDGKIIGAEKQLLNILNADLSTLSSIISEIELIISSKQQKNLTINNHSFSINEIPIISLEEIKIYQLTQTESNISDLQTLSNEISLENEYLNIPPLQTPESEIKIEEPLPNLQENFDFTLQQTQEELKPDEELFPEPKQSEEEIKPVMPEGEITISFDNTFDEINKILSLEEDEANKLITEELKKASEDLGIDYETISNLYDELIKQFETEKTPFYKAIEENNYEKIHKIAHKLKGAALNLRLSKLALILKNIDEESKEYKPIEQIKFLVDKFYNFVNKIKTETENIAEIPENIKNLILLTIKDYLSTQNEKKFKKDIKYIEKILKTKINSLEDLQKLIKE